MVKLQLPIPKLRKLQKLATRLNSLKPNLQKKLKNLLKKQENFY